MPTYAYQCGSCGNEFDLRQGFDASTEQPCPVCEGIGRRRLSLPAVIYKGSGFYTTDYARKGMSDSSSSASSSSSSSAAASPEKSGAGTADSKSKASSASSASSTSSE